MCHFPICILGQVWYLTVSIPDLCTLTYFAVNTVWAYLEQFSDVILRLGTIHMLISFGALMADSGQSEMSESTFGVVSTMLSGEKPHKICIPFVYW